jgi:DNA-binding beta-propeller fold protein YncE
VASGNDLYLSTGDSVNEYDGTTGALIAGFSTITAVSPHGLAISGTALYVSNTGNSTITEYDAITGAQVTGYSSPGGLNDNWGIAASDSTLYVANFGPGSSGTLNAYDMATGSAVAGFTPSIAGETDFVAYGSVPEPGTWGMAVAGIGLLGYVRHFRRTRQP